MKQAMAVMTSYDSEDWYTPSRYTDLARRVLGEITLDPASADYPQQWINAKTYWTKADDGFNREWFGKVWLNPPYGKVDGKSQQKAWLDKLAREVESGRVKEAVLLVNSKHGYAWYEEMWRKYTVCCARDRIRFIRPDGRDAGQAKCAQTFVYFGPDIGRKRFEQVFSPIGRVLTPTENASQKQARQLRRDDRIVAPRLFV